jgi:NitT/TauT family transport system substrate-binding protein
VASAGAIEKADTAIDVRALSPPGGGTYVSGAPDPRQRSDAVARFVIQPHSRLHEWVAEDRGYFAAEGLDYQFQADGLFTRSTASVRRAEDAPLDVRSGAFEDMTEGRACDVSSACHWAVNAAATLEAGKMWGHAYSMCPAGIFVAPDSGYQRPEDLAGVPVAVGYHSGSHYSTIQGLEPFLDRSQIALSFAGLPNDRVRLLLGGEVPAAAVFGAQYYVLEQLGYRKITDTTFMMGALVSATADEEDVRRYFRALRSAQRDIDLEQERYKQFWSREMPEDLAERVDVRRFGPGERIVFEPYTREMYEATQAWMRSWDLLDTTVSGSLYEDAVRV